MAHHWCAILILATVGMFSPDCHAATSMAPKAKLELTGQPQTIASTKWSYYFNANTRNGSGARVTFSVRNKPDWLKFNTLTGELSGTPDRPGIFRNIAITVSDGTTTAAMTPFSIAVTGPSKNNAKAIVSWSPPLKNTDGTVFNNSAGFIIYYGTSATSLKSVVTVGSRTATSYTLTGLTKGLTYYFAVAAINDMKMEGPRSAVASLKL